MSDEFELTPQDWRTRHAAERSYPYRVITAMRSREIYTARMLIAITKVPRPKIYSTLKILVDHGVVEKAEPEPINYPELWEYMGQMSRRNWKKRNNVTVCRGRPIMKWRRKV